VRAKIFTINGLSAHADQGALLGWLDGFRKPPQQTWVVHGETLPAQTLCDRIRERGWNAKVPEPGQTTEIA
jgi:metallo-beta-lactamase family protein